MKRAITLAVISMAALLASGAQARVSEEEAKRLETDLTPIGAERAGNADGTIPAWTGSMMGAPENLNYGGDGSPLPDPYADEKPLFSITAANMDQYAENLTEGLKALFKLRPDTFRMDVYPSHRDGGYPQIIIDRAKWNATRTELANNGEVVVNWTGGTAFPIPENGIEVMWNGRSGGISNPTQVGGFEDVSVFASGAKTMFGVESNHQLYLRGSQHSGRHHRKRHWLHTVQDIRHKNSARGRQGRHEPGARPDRLYHGCPPRLDLYSRHAACAAGAQPGFRYPRRPRRPADR